MLPPQLVGLMLQFDGFGQQLVDSVPLNKICSTHEGAVVVPSDAVQVGPDGQQVFIVKADKRVEVRPVTVGQSQAGESIISNGLAPGEMVVREGQFLLGPNSRVDIKQTASADGSTGAGQGEGRKGRGERGKAKNNGDERGAS